MIGIGTGTKEFLRYPVLQKVPDALGSPIRGVVHCRPTATIDPLDYDVSLLGIDTVFSPKGIGRDQWNPRPELFSPWPKQRNMSGRAGDSSAFRCAAGWGFPTNRHTVEVLDHEAEVSHIEPKRRIAFLAEDFVEYLSQLGQVRAIYFNSPPRHWELLG